MDYQRRILDGELDELLQGLPAIAIEGPKAVGKTASAQRRAKTVHRLDDPAVATVAAADPARLALGRPPILIDEWQRVPEVWDVVRRAVDEDPAPGRFLITGSATPLSPPTHSGAGRIVRTRLRPLSLAEREPAEPTISLQDLLSQRGSPIEGETRADIVRYVEEIVASGFPGIRGRPARARRAQLEGYLSAVVHRDFEEIGQRVRKPELLRRWMTAYGAGTATTAAFETIRAAASGQSVVPARKTVTAYRDTLERLWLLDPVPAWLPTRNYFSRLTHPDKHHLADPALAVTLLGLDAGALLQGESGSLPVPRNGTLLGHLFESLVTLSVRVYAQAAEASLKHLRTKGGRHEIDLIVERRDGRVLAIEVKAANRITDRDVKHLHWLRSKIGLDLIDALVIHTGPSAYRRPDGIAVVPAVLLGP